jgi:NTP pyrophosphatase (non-canonical NTP hydrolase)
MRKITSVDVPVLAGLLTKKFGPAYIPHKLSEECLELSIAIHKIKAITQGFTKVTPELRDELAENLYEEIAHVKVFLSLIESDLFGDPERIEAYMDERYGRLNAKL